MLFNRNLLENGLFDHEAWPPILMAWGSRAFRPGEWGNLLEILDHPGLLTAQSRGVAEVVRGRVKQRDPIATKPMLRSSLRLAEKVLQRQRRRRLRFFQKARTG